MIELKNITFSYDVEEEIVLKNLNLQVKKGSCLVIEGENGCGKSTLFRILNGISFPQEGQYFFENVEITQEYLKKNKNAKSFHKKIGYLFQNPDLMLFNASVYDEIAFGPRQMGLSDEEVDRRTKDCLQIFHLEKFADKAPYHLSGGQKKRVALAAILSLNPEVLILDEPYAGLDRKTQVWLTSFLQQLKELGKTIIIATHSEEIRDLLADEIVRLED